MAEGMDRELRAEEVTRKIADASDAELLRSASGEQPVHVSATALLRARVEHGAQGVRLGRYALLRVLGEGGMGVVFAAYDEELDRRVAIKLLRSADLKAQADPAWLIAEARAMARLSHPNIVQIYDVGQLEGQVFVAMEFVVGATLREWMAEKPRPWREVVDVVGEAGRGLSAVHEAGLVHCDFKPHNVIVGRDGRPRVLDFGLALLRERNKTRPRRSLEESQRLSLMAGTPAYMAPELYLHAEPDAGSDQFAFCVVLHEALYGQRPFLGKGFEELGRAITQGLITPPPDATRAPAWLRRIVLRGLSLDPKQRWPSMASLLAALARDPSRLTRRWLTGAGAALLVGVAGINFAERRAMQAELAANRCAVADELAEIWDEPRRQAARAAVIGSGLTYAEDTWRRVETRLDAYAADWTAMRAQACEDNHDGTQSDSLYDLRVACLQQRLGDLDAFVDVLSSADSGVVSRAVRASFELRPLAACADVPGLLAPIAPPSTPEQAAEVTRVRAEIAAVRAAWAAGRVKPAEQRLTAATPAVEATAYRPLQAEARYAAGLLADGRGDYPAAAEQLEAALWAAEASRHDQIAAEAALRLVFVVGVRQAKIEDGERWERHASAVLERRGARELESRWYAMRGLLANRAGRHAEAIAHAEAALAAGTRILGPDHYEVVTLLNNLGSLHGMAGDHVLARKYMLRALAQMELVLGPEHPDLAIILANLGGAALGQGELATARELYQRALAIDRAAFGEEHPDIARIYANLGTLAARGDDYQAALDLHEKALAMRRKLLGPAHADTASSEANVADTYLHIDKADLALAAAESALAGHAASVGDAHPRYAASLTVRGLAELQLGQTRLASVTLTRALSLLAASGSHDRECFAEAHFGLARAQIADRRARAEAVAHALRAVEEFRAAGPIYAREVGEVEAWIAAQQRP